MGECFVEPTIDAEGLEARGAQAKGSVSAFSLTGRVVLAVCVLIGYGLPALGQRSERGAAMSTTRPDAPCPCDERHADDVL